VPAPDLLDALVAGDASALSPPVPAHDLRDYVEREIRGGFPSLVLDQTPDTRDVWVDSYLDQLLTRDGHLRIADREQYKLARYFEAVAANSAGIADHKTIYDAAAVEQPTRTTGSWNGCSSPSRSRHGRAADWIV
jgi:predicted AAA+ superfamily ATPase